MPTTQTKPPDDPRMWRRLIARVHPDAPGGDHDLFIWTGAVRDAVCSGDRPGPNERDPDPPPTHPPDDKPRTPYPTGADFEEITRTALQMGEAGAPYGEVLLLLADCEPLEHLAYEQDRGASYKRLAAIAHAWGMTKAERVGWYRVCEALSLSDRHAGHILAKLKKGAA